MNNIGIATDSCVGWNRMCSTTSLVDTINGTGSMALANGILFAADPDVTYTLPQRNKAPHMADALRSWHGYVVCWAAP